MSAINCNVAFRNDTKVRPGGVTLKGEVGATWAAAGTSIMTGSSVGPPASTVRWGFNLIR